MKAALTGFASFLGYLVTFVIGCMVGFVCAIVSGVL